MTLRSIGRAAFLGLALSVSALSVSAAAAEFTPADTVRHVEVVVGAGGEWELPGTLSLPAGAGPFPAVVLVHGSGPHDRDQTVGPNKTFRELALGLVDRGVAVIRYEKRSKQHAAKMASISGLTVHDEVVEDALAAVALLRSTPGIAPEGIVVAGHSLGGMVAPRIAALDSRLAGIAILAGPVRTLDQLVLDQVAYIRTLDDTPAAQIPVLDFLEREAKAVAAMDPATADSSASPMGVPMSYWLDLRSYHPDQVAQSLKMPILVVHAGRDYQVTGADFALWKAALGERKDVTFREYPDLNHLFITGTGMARPSEYGNVGEVAGVVIEELAAWVKGVGGR